jgi:hypothetical protein
MKYLIALLALSSCAFAQNNTGVLMIDTLRPKGSADTFPIVLGNEVQGGPFSVSNVTAMSNIPSARLVPGSLAYVTNDQTFRTWDGSTWAGQPRFNGSLFVTKTNVGPFEGMINALNSNNTTLSNETLFRVGRAEATNQSAQFGFRLVRTNNGGEGFAVFSVFGYNALMMIGPSDRSRTNAATNAAIEADIWTINQTNRVMTLRDTNTGALTMHQDLGFNAGLTNTTPTNTNTPAVWLRVWVGTNNYRLPLYQ